MMTPSTLDEGLAGGEVGVGGDVGHVVDGRGGRLGGLEGVEHLVEGAGADPRRQAASMRSRAATRPAKLRSASSSPRPMRSSTRRATVSWLVLTATHRPSAHCHVPRGTE